MKCTHSEKIFMYENQKCVWEKKKIKAQADMSRYFSKMFSALFSQSVTQIGRIRLE